MGSPSFPKRLDRCRDPTPRAPADNVAQALFIPFPRVAPTQGGKKIHILIITEELFMY